MPDLPDEPGQVFMFQTGSSVPTGKLLAFISNDGTGRMHADSFSVTATAVPEPGTVVLFGLGAVGLMVARK